MFEVERIKELDFRRSIWEIMSGVYRGLLWVCMGDLKLLDPPKGLGTSLSRHIRKH